MKDFNQIFIISKEEHNTIREKNPIDILDEFNVITTGIFWLQLNTDVLLDKWKTISRMKNELKELNYNIIIEKTIQSYYEVGNTEKTIWIIKQKKK